MDPRVCYRTDVEDIWSPVFSLLRGKDGKADNFVFLWLFPVAKNCLTVSAWLFPFTSSTSLVFFVHTTSLRVALGSRWTRQEATEFRASGVKWFEVLKAATSL